MLGQATGLPAAPPFGPKALPWALSPVLVWLIPFFFWFIQCSEPSRAWEVRHGLP